MIHKLLAMPPVWRMGLIILACLVLASAITLWLRRRWPERDLSELTARVRAWWVMATVFFGAVAVSNTLSLVFFALMSFWALKEYVTLLRTRPADHGALVLTFLTIPVQYYWIATGWFGMFIVFIPVWVFLLLPLRLVMAKEPEGLTASAGTILWGLMAFGFGLSHAGYLLQLPSTPGSEANGRTLVLFLVFVVEVSDVMQYVWGKTFGRRKILPVISPNKTWEGFIGGVLTTALLSLLVRFLTPFGVWETLGVSLMLCLAGFAGGAVMSAVKRDFGVKDFGDLIPGHGGTLDRVDSLCYAAPVFFHYLVHYHIKLG